METLKKRVTRAVIAEIGDQHV